MGRTTANSPTEQAAITLLQDLQQQFADGLAQVAGELQQPAEFIPLEWLRDEGRHGGGRRLVAPTDSIFDRGSVNFSHVHYSDLAEKPLSSATALSTIIHPRHPLAPSVHIHISWTQMKTGEGYWRMMADLNPAIPVAEYQQDFDAILAKVAEEQYTEGKTQGEKYFYIPALERHRGVSHFYLEGYFTDKTDVDRQLAQRFGDAVTRGYTDILRRSLADAPEPTATQRQTQLDYHTVYFFQVLTLDRGTTSGLLVHNQNDVGTLGSLPSHVNKPLLASWQQKVPSPQDELVARLVAALPDEDVCPVGEETKAQLAQVVRSHYQKHPEALKLQARGNILPPTVANHGR